MEEKRNHTQKDTTCFSPELSKTQTRVEEDANLGFNFSSATSLESSMSLVSGAADITSAILDNGNGAREKRLEDGRVEFWYSNGNR